MNRNSLKQAGAATGGEKLSGRDALLMLEQEEEMDRCLNQLQRLEEASRKVHKDGKKGTECIFELLKNEQKLSHDLSSSGLCHHDEQLRIWAEEYLSVVKHMDQSTNEMILVSQKALVEPLKKFITLFTHTGTVLKKREYLMQECQKWKTRVEKLREKERTGPNIVKLEQTKNSLLQAQKELQKHNSLLLVELPQLLNNRISYFQPCFEALISGQVDYFGANTKLFADLARSIKSAPRLRDEEFQQQLQGRLAEIRALSIVGDV